MGLGILGSAHGPMVWQWYGGFNPTPLKNDGVKVKVSWDDYSQLGCFHWQNIKDLLVGGIPTPLNNMKVKWDDIFQIYGK